MIRPTMNQRQLAAIALCLVSCAAWADLARVSVTWTQPDLYVTAEGAYIRTSGCSELTISDSAVLRYFEGDDLLTFSYGASCRVVDVFK